jgi:hypothetical protein
MLARHISFLVYFDICRTRTPPLRLKIEATQHILVYFNTCATQTQVVCQRSKQHNTSSSISSLHDTNTSSSVEDRSNTTRPPIFHHLHNPSFALPVDDQGNTTHSRLGQACTQPRGHPAKVNATQHTLVYTITCTTFAHRTKIKATQQVLVSFTPCTTEAPASLLTFLSPLAQQKPQLVC